MSIQTHSYTEIIQALKYIILFQVENFGRRRLATILVGLKFAEHMKEAVTYIEQGHIRVGPQTVTYPAFLVIRNMEDFVTWVDNPKIKVLENNENFDDYDAMN